MKSELPYKIKVANFSFFLLFRRIPDSPQKALMIQYLHPLPSECCSFAKILKQWFLANVWFWIIIQ